MCRIQSVTRIDLSLPEAQIVVDSEFEDSIKPTILDDCCLAFIDGNDLMQGACQTQIIPVLDDSNLVYDETNLCRSMTVTQTEFILPVAQTVVNTEATISFTPQSLDACCLSFIEGNEELRGVCEVSITKFHPQLVYDDLNMCRTRLVTRTELILPDSQNVAMTDDKEIFMPESIDKCCQAFIVGDVSF